MKRASLLAAMVTVIGSPMACGGSNPVAPTPLANIAGSYLGKVIASSACSANLPSQTRELTLGAEVTQTGATAQVLFHPYGGNSVTVAGAVSGQTVDFPSVSFGATTPGGAVSFVATTGKATVAANNDIAGTLSGTYQTASGSSCNAGDHQLQLKRCVVTCSGGICSCQ